MKFWKIFLTLLVSTSTAICQTKSLDDTLFHIGDKLPIRPIYFELGKPNFNELSLPYLDSVANFLLKNTNLSIQINVHSDTRSNVMHQSTCLSCARSKTIRDYLISSGIDSQRIQAFGFNGTKPIIKAKEIEKLKTKEEKEKAHQINRRTEFIITRTDYKSPLKNEEIQVIAKLISPLDKDNKQLVTFKIIKAINGALSKDTLIVVSHPHPETIKEADTVLLHLLSSTGKTEGSNYYTFPDNDEKKGIENIDLSYVSLAYWEACETGKGECPPLQLIRNPIYKTWYLFMPCGGTSTTVELFAADEKKPIQATRVSSSECPPVLNLTTLKNGKYQANMRACGLGGQIQLNISSKP